MIVAGPWLISTIVLGILVLFIREKLNLLPAIIMYIFCFSQIFVGIYQFVVTRFLADKLYKGDIELYIPTFMGVLLVTLVPQALFAGYFLSTLESPFQFRLFAFVAYLIISAIWIILLFLGILRAFQWVVWSFVLGGCISLILGIALGRQWQHTGVLLGFVTGQGVILSILIWVFLSEFPWNKLIDFSFLSYFYLYPSLSLLGLCYYLSFWVDKFIYRASSLGALIAPKWLYAAPSYEMSAFVAQMTIIPALAIFFLKAETDFYIRFREFFASVAQRHPYSVIESRNNATLRSVKEGFIMILQFQGIITIISILLAPQLFSLWLDEAQITILRVLLPGTFFQICLFLTVILMLYLELFREALISCVIFFIANCTLTIVFLGYYPLPPGCGFTLSAFCAFLYAAVSLVSSLKRLPEIIFMRQLKPPVIAHKSSFYRQEGMTWQHLRYNKDRRKYAKRV
jgi:uncharacterized membrane protein